MAPNIRAQQHTEADRPCNCYTLPLTSFNSQPLAEADIFTSLSSLTPYRFNSQPLEEADLLLRQQLRVFGVVSTHSLTQRLTDMVYLVVPEQHVSTHSLTQRLTGEVRSMFNVKIVSTHSLTQRLTADVLPVRVNAKVFQLTASRRG